ncbi:MAG: hypothetical protein KGS47_14775 [Chloroflexi bacterium]|nr:hypothetical protein [Chloroflexota bacterium]
MSDYFTYPDPTRDHAGFGQRVVFGDADHVIAEALMIRPLGREFEVICHTCTRTGLLAPLLRGVATLRPTTRLARLLRAEPHYHGGPVRLVACAAGAETPGVAQNLADLLQVVVVAPTAPLGPWHGRLEIYGGRWRRFRPFAHA